MSAPPDRWRQIEVKYRGKDGAQHVETALTGLDGSYAIDGLCAGLATVSANAPGATFTELITAGDVCTLNLTLGSPAGGASSADGASKPLAQLVDGQLPDVALKSVAPVPPDQMAPTDFDPDFPATKPSSPAPVASGCSASGPAAFAALALLSLASRRRRGHNVSTGDISWLTRRR